MSHVARLAVFALVAACHNPKPPAGEEPAVPSADLTPEPAALEPAPPELTSGDAVASDAPVVETLFVRDTLADCQAEGAQRCLQVRSSEQEDWRNFFGSIEGFQFEPTYAYELRVAVSPLPNAPADAPALRYRLLEVVTKRKAAP